MASSPTIPVVNFSSFYSSSPSERSQTGTAIFEALRDIGFVYLTNHGVSKQVIDEAFTQSRVFFDLPLVDKLKAPHPPESWNHRGYSQIGQEKISLYPDALNTGTTSTDKVPSVLDMKESFDLGRENDPITPNIYPPPEIVPEFRSVTNRLFSTLHNFGLDVLHALALGLQLEDEHFFSHFHGKDGKEDPKNQLRLLHYPAVSKAVAARRHLDTAFGGLEVEASRGGQYIPVPVIPGAILVNIGDLLQMWSNDTLRSTRHHIGLPDANTVGDGEEIVMSRRFSIPYFITPDLDAVGRPKKNIEPVRAWDYIVRSIGGAY
ncbi:hypothetical protein M378DRAFT_185987 [Amanita muscaria Koide BX008]|uniref:Fe2OG dioxygenase domain-containing protein n=1 Tax=Amanita muscaria (strain Koide BX008) TaxID=946122 RepID=A0A0C2XC29_AMAMK|nr:hypothetical protein M378DRAFT_185987 [Amanita muscaria Koide BX008]